MLLSWLRSRRRKRLLAEPFPTAWLDCLGQHVPHYQYLDEAERHRLQDSVRILIAEKEWEGCGGLELTDEIRVAIAGFAGILTLHLPDEHFERVPSILVYPAAYVAPGQETADSPLVEDSAREGETHYRGPVILNWAEIEGDAAAPELGKNLVFHEFAHQLDMVNGEADGIPLMPDPAELARWQRVCKREFERLGQAVDYGEQTVLDPYGAENEAEFFAVVTECFFNRPLALRRRHRDLYQCFRDFYHQDPVARNYRWES